MELKIIAHIHTDFTAKFGIPRQSGLVDSICGKIIFEPEYRNPDAVRGLEEFSHIWLLWQFSKAIRTEEGWSATVAPPRLGGKVRKGVFATRSPYRPNSIGLSSVRLDHIEIDEKDGPILYVYGADLLDGTPIYDIKPYLSFTDSHPDAKNGFAGERLSYALKVEIPDELMAMIPQSKRDALTESLSQDPRPAYITEPDTPFGFEYAGFDVRFKVNGDTLTVYEIIRL